MSKPQLIDTRPLPKPVNGLRWMAAQLNHLAVHNKDPGITPQQRKSARESAAWLEQLATSIPWKSTNPVLMMAVGNAALNAGAREELLTVLGDIDRLTAEAEGSSAPAGEAEPWAPVPE